MASMEQLTKHAKCVLLHASLVLEHQITVSNVFQDMNLIQAKNVCKLVHAHMEQFQLEANALEHARMDSSLTEAVSLVVHPDMYQITSMVAFNQLPQHSVKLLNSKVVTLVLTNVLSTLGQILLQEHVIGVQQIVYNA